jgi:hypothetical protein
MYRINMRGMTYGLPFPIEIQLRKTVRECDISCSEWTSRRLRILFDDVYRVSPALKSGPVRIEEIRVGYSGIFDDANYLGGVLYAKVSGSRYNLNARRRSAPGHQHDAEQDNRS